MAPPPPQPVPKTGLDRDADPCLLVCNIEERASIAIKEIESLLAELIGERGWDPSIARVAGKDVDTHFKVEFLSKTNGPGQVDELISSLFDKSTRKWKELSVKDVDGNSRRAYLGKDVPPRISRVSGASKRLAKDLKLALGGTTTAWFRPYDSKIAVNSIPTARVVWKKVDGKLTDQLEIQWLEKPLADLVGKGLDKQATTDAFLARENLKWVS